MDIEQRILSAFQTEHREHLESIRTLLADPSFGQPEHATALDEAYRMAHTLKGGARICDLQPIESLGHQLEAVFEQVRAGELDFEDATRAVVRQTLDAIEDWMLALAEQRSLPDLQATHAALGELLSDQPTNEPDLPPAETPSLQTRLQAAFQHEHQTYLQQLEEFHAEWQAGDAIGHEDLEEAYRLAHSLRAAAQMVEAETVEQSAQELESLLFRLRSGEVDLSENAVATVGKLLQTTQAKAETWTQTHNTPEGSEETPTELIESTDTPADNAKATVPEATRMLDTIRVSTLGLDRLLESSGRLLAEGFRQNAVFQEWKVLSAQISEWEREWQTVRHFATSELHDLTATPRFRRIVRYLDYAERQLTGIAKQARQARVAHARGSWRLTQLGRQMETDVREARMVPAESVFQGFRKLVRDLAQQSGKEIEFVCDGLDRQADRVVLQGLKDPLMHVLRNAVVHGIQSPAERERNGQPRCGSIRLSVETVGNRLTITVSDDGLGLDLSAIRQQAVEQNIIAERDAAQRSPDELARLIFQPGFSTSTAVTELSGRGMGLSVVQEAVRRMQGEIDVPMQAPGTTIVLQVPLSISSQHVLLVAACEQTFALPIHCIRRLLRVPIAKVEMLEGHPFLHFESQPVQVVSLAHLLGIAGPNIQARSDYVYLAVLKGGTGAIAVAVDGFLRERDAVIEDLTGPAARVQTFSGAVSLEDESIALVIDPSALLRRLNPARAVATVQRTAPPPEKRRPTVLIVDDSFTTRTLEKSILETHGYEVRVAVNGSDALNQLRSKPVDLVISDVQMPHLDGFQLLAEIKHDEKLRKTPVILVTSLDRRQDQERGLELGADAYIIKRKFDHQDLLATIRQII